MFLHCTYILKIPACNYICNSFLYTHENIHTNVVSAALTTLSVNSLVT